MLQASRASAAASSHDRQALNKIPNPTVQARGAAVPRSPRAQAWTLARDLAASDPGRFALAVGLLLTAGVTEAFGLMMIVPLIQVAGLADAASDPDSFSAAAASVAAWFGVPPTLPGVLGAFLVLSAVRAAVAWRRNVLVMRLRLEFMGRAREDLCAAVAGASWGHLLGRRRSDIQHVLTDEVGRMGAAAFLLVQMAVGVTLASIQFAVAVAVSPAVAGAALLLGVPLALAARPMVRRSHALGERLTGSGRVLRGLMTDFLDGLKTAKSHNAEAPHLRRMEQAAAAARERQIEFAGLSAATRGALQLVAAAALAGLVWFALAGAGLSLPELTVLALVFARVTPKALNLLQLAQQIANALPACASVADLLEELRAAAEPAGGTSAAAPANAPRGGIEVRSLDFAYPGADSPVLRGIDCRIPANGIFAITGPSGAGKSTLADLLLGLLEPSRGEILVGGAPLREAGLVGWRGSVAYLAQEPFLLHDSVRANLSWLAAGVSEADMWQALDLAGASAFVAALPNSLDTAVGDRGGRLSGGERQRVALAAALLRKPTLLVLDEPASHLDPDNEARVVETLRGLRGRVTIVAIVHGGALLREADQTLVLREGQVEALGPWPEIADSASGAGSSPARADTTASW